LTGFWVGDIILTMSKKLLGFIFFGFCSNIQANDFEEFLSNRVHSSALRECAPVLFDSFVRGKKCSSEEGSFESRKFFNSFWTNYSALFGSRLLNEQAEKNEVYFICLDLNDYCGCNFDDVLEPELVDWMNFEEFEDFRNRPKAFVNKIPDLDYDSIGYDENKFVNLENVLEKVRNLLQKNVNLYSDLKSDKDLTQNWRHLKELKKKYQTAICLTDREFFQNLCIDFNLTLKKCRQLASLELHLNWMIFCESFSDKKL